MEYTYNIINEVYEWMYSKEKDIEVRLLKEKSSLIQINDYITFFNEQDKNKYIKVKVIDKKLFNNVDDLLKTYDVNRMMPHHTNEELKSLLNDIYGEKLINGQLVAFTFTYLSSDKDILA